MNERPIQSLPCGGVVVTGEGVDLYALVSLKHAMQLEAKWPGPNRWTYHKHAMRQFGIQGRCTAITRALAMERVLAEIGELEQRVQHLNRAFDTRN